VGVEIGTNIIHDAEHTSPNGRSGIIVTDFSPKHPLVNHSSILMSTWFSPGVQRLKTMPQTADAPKVEELAFTAQREGGTSAPQRYSLIAASKRASKRHHERGTTRIVVAGDSVS